MRKVAARTVPDLTRAIRSFIPQFHPNECANYFAHAGFKMKGIRSRDMIRKSVKRFSKKIMHKQ